MGEPSESPQQTPWLGWIPLPALVLVGDGSAVAANERWADLSPVPADGQGWLEAVEPVSRPALRSMLRLAATTGEPGRTDCQVTGPRGGRWSRWWWQPFPPAGLVVCVAVIDGGPAERLPVAGGLRYLLAREQPRAALPAGISAELAMAVVNRIFQAGLALEAAARLLPGSAATPVLRVLDDLDQLVRDIRNAALKSPPPPTTSLSPGEARSEAGIAAIGAATPQPAGDAGELLDSVVNGVFTAGLSLQAAMGPPILEAAAQRITEALRFLDEVVQEVRNHLFAGQGQGTPPGHNGRPRPDVHERADPTGDDTAMLQERRAALRERVTQTAYALHLAAADTAALLEQQGNLLDQPRRIDYPTEIKRWRVFADQAKQIAERWERPEAPDTPQD